MSKQEIHLDGTTLDAGLRPFSHTMFPVKPLKLGPYRLEDRLGSGGMGEVFDAFDERLERRVAVKRLRSDGPPSVERRQRLRREARAMAKLRHSWVVQIHAEGDHLGPEKEEERSR